MNAALTKQVQDLGGQVLEWKKAARQRSVCVTELSEKLDEVRKELEKSQCQLGRLRDVLEDVLRMAREDDSSDLGAMIVLKYGDRNVKTSKGGNG